MNIQIYGNKKCFNTKKAERYMKERGIKYQFIDLHEYGLSKGVFQSVKAALGLEPLINQKSKAYQTLYMDYIDENKRELTLFENPTLYNTPIVRNGKQVTLGLCPEIWSKWE